MSQKPFRLIGSCCLVAAAAWVTLGFATFFFEKTSGRIIQYSAAQTATTSGFPGINYGPHEPTYAPAAYVVYEYEVLGVAYVETGFGFGARPWTFSPLGKMSWEQNAREGADTVVYYLEAHPQVSVLSRGFDQLFVFLLVGIGLSLRWFSAWIDSHVE